MQIRLKLFRYFILYFVLTAFVGFLLDYFVFHTYYNKISYYISSGVFYLFIAYAFSVASVKWIKFKKEKGL
ncbi:MAG: hypothetical protein JST36_11040 [Bacteroidetes bacterium]|nr:hypothetical protein [Bacteroidota bacterium]